jgi:glycyl-tRNA synthetase beta chain
VKTENLLIELLTEELPPGSQNELGSNFCELISNELLEKNLIDKIETNFFSTPRRLGIRINYVKEKAKNENKLIKLMPKRIGFDDKNKPTQALIKKLSSIGEENLNYEKLIQKKEKDEVVIYIEKKLVGNRLESELSGVINRSLNQLPIKKMMSYQLDDGWTTVNFVRPIKNLLVLYGSKVIKVEVLGFTSNNYTKGHRFESDSDIIKIDHANNYEEILLRKGKVIVSFENRKNKIKDKINECRKFLSNSLNIIEDNNLLNEVTALVESPNVLIGTFEKNFLKVPKECLILTMKSNQKYFPLFTKENSLSNKFIIVSNSNPIDTKKIVEGNEKVIRPRLADAQFFYEQDKKEGLNSFSLKLKKVIYHNKLGSQYDRAKKVAKILEYINTQLKLGHKTDFNRLATFSKADLLSQMVGEFPELQGVMGRYYAIEIKESEDFANAIEDHYKPKFSKDDLPRDSLGEISALADKFETLMSLFSISEIPTGDKDPFGLRRNVIGIIRILLEKNIPLNFIALIDNFMAPINDKQKILLKKFIYERLFNYLKEQQYSSEEVDALVSLKPHYLNDLLDRLVALNSFMKLKQSEDLASSNKRVANLLKKYTKHINSEVNTKIFSQQEEIDLHDKLNELQPIILNSIKNKDFTSALDILVELKGPIDNFFNKVMVNSEDDKVKSNRHSLLNQLYLSLNSVADISKLVS